MQKQFFYRPTYPIFFRTITGNKQLISLGLTGNKQFPILGIMALGKTTNQLPGIWESRLTWWYSLPSVENAWIMEIGFRVITSEQHLYQVLLEEFTHGS